MKVKERLCEKIDLKFLENRIIYISGIIEHEESLKIVFLLKALEEKKIEKIRLYLSIQWISFQDALLLYDLIHSLKSEVHTYAMGMLSSFGIFVFLAGEKRFMLENSFVSVSRLEIKSEGQKSYLKGYKEYERKLKSHMCAIMREKHKGKLDEDFLREELFWSREQLCEWNVVNAEIGGEAI